MALSDNDFLLFDHGSVLILRPDSDAARDWVDDNLPDDALWFGGGVAIEPRYIGPIVDGIADAGLSLS
jgi:hypothetical protein